MELRAVGDGIHACLQPDRGWGWSNSGLVAREGGLVVDTLMDVPHTRRMLALYADVVDGLPGQLVNTHHNADHCWGNQLLADGVIYGHRLCAEAMLRDISPALLEGLRTAPDLPPGARWFAADLAGFDFAGIELTPPNRLVDDDGLALELGGRPLLLRYVGPAHTAGDLIVHLPEDGVVFAGDVLFRRCTPIGWEGTTARWCEALEGIAALAPEVIVPGHGPPCGPEGALEMRDYLLYVQGEAARFHAQGLSALEAAKRLDLGPYADWTQPERLAFNVARAYRELDGGPWDAPVDAMALLDDCVALRAHWDEREGRARP